MFLRLSDVRRVLQDHGREGRRSADLPVVAEDSGGVGDRRPRNRERHLDAGAIGRRGWRRRGRLRLSNTAARDAEQNDERNDEQPRESGVDIHDVMIILRSLIARSR